MDVVLFLIALLVGVGWALYRWLNTTSSTRPPIKPWGNWQVDTWQDYLASLSNVQLRMALANTVQDGEEHPHRVGHPVDHFLITRFGVSEPIGPLIEAELADREI